MACMHVLATDFVIFSFIGSLVLKRYDLFLANTTSLLLNLKAKLRQALPRMHYKASELQPLVP